MFVTWTYKFFFNSNSLTLWTPEAGIPAARYINATDQKPVYRRHGNATGQKPVYRISFLMRTGTGMPES